MLLTKTTAAQNDVALSYHRVRGLYFPAVIFAATIIKIVRYYTCAMCYSMSCSFWVKKYHFHILKVRTSLQILQTLKPTDHKGENVIIKRKRKGSFLSFHDLLF